MSLFRREQRQWIPEPVVSPFPGVDMFGNAAPTASRAMQVSAVWACVRLLADAVSMMPLHAYTMRGEIRVPIADPPLITSPSADATTTEWVYMTMVSLLLRGNAYGVSVKDRMGYPRQIDLLDPEQVSIRVDDSGRPAYYSAGKAIERDKVFHLRAFRFPGRRDGLSPIEYAASQISTDVAAAKFGRDFLRSGGHPSALLSTDASLTPDQAKVAKERFMTAVKDREPAILSGGLEYKSIQINPEESQFLATQKYGVAEIARIYGVPPEMIAGEASNSMTYANVEQRALDFLTYSVQPWLTRLEAAYAQLLPGHQHVRFDTSVLTRTDYLTTMQATAIGIASKQTTTDEARALRDEPPLTDQQKADLALVPLEITPAGKPKALPGAAAAGAAAATAPEGEPA